MHKSDVSQGDFAPNLQALVDAGPELPEAVKAESEAMFGGSAKDCQLGNEILVSETGFGAVDAEMFPTLDILMAWQVEPVEVG